MKEYDPDKVSITLGDGTELANGQCVEMPKKLEGPKLSITGRRDRWLCFKDKTISKLWLRVGDRVEINNAGAEDPHRLTGLWEVVDVHAIDDDTDKIDLLRVVQ